MTTKELLYVEDALGHEKYFQAKFRMRSLKHAWSRWRRSISKFFKAFMDCFKRSPIFVMDERKNSINER